MEVPVVSGAGQANPAGGAAESGGRSVSSVVAAPSSVRPAYAISSVDNALHLVQLLARDGCVRVSELLLSSAACLWASRFSPAGSVIATPPASAVLTRPNARGAGNDSIREWWQS